MIKKILFWIKKILLWIMFTFIRGFEMIGIALFILGFAIGFISLSSVLIWWAIINREYLILAEIITGCIFIFGLTFRLAGMII